MTTGRMSTARWSYSGRVSALPSEKRPLPHPRSTTRGALRPNRASRSSGPSGGSFFSAVCVHRDGSRISPGMGTPNSRSICRFFFGGSMTAPGSVPRDALLDVRGRGPLADIALLGQDVADHLALRGQHRPAAEAPGAEATVLLEDVRPLLRPRHLGAVELRRLARLLAGDPDPLV